jgi:phosphatidylethanolamine N-methyltransferase
LQEVLTETKQLLESSRSQVIPLIATDIDMYDLSSYSLKIVNDSKDGFELGQPIKIQWNAPENHGAKDWIGIFEVKANKARHITNISSRGLWHWVNAAIDKESEDTIFPPETPLLTEGVVEFSGSKLPWKVGTYEFRYQHDNKHNVMAHSIAFEIKAPTNPSVIDVKTTQQTVLKFIQNTLGNNTEIMPTTPEEEYVGMGEIESRHLVHCIKLAYNVEFAWEVVATDKSAARLAKRIIHAREALSPFKSEASRRLSASSLHLPSTSCSPLMTKVSTDTL